MIHFPIFQLGFVGENGRGTLEHFGFYDEEGNLNPGFQHLINIELIIG